MVMPTPKQSLESFFKKYDPVIAKQGKAILAKLRWRLPGAVEMVYDNYNALAIGFGPNERASEAIVSLAVFARGVNLYFIRGAKLPDPHKLLEGNGNQGRFIRLHNATQLNQPAIASLLHVATQLGKTPLPTTGRGYTIIKSISAKQRPRRPPAS